MIRTTHLTICPETISFDSLSQRYQLVAYRFPTFFKFKIADRSGILYPKLIAEYKRTLDYPFYFFTHDKPTSFYVLVPLENEPPRLTLDALNGANANPEQLDFEAFRAADRLHILVKLLLSEFFWNASEQDRRICQPNFFTHAKAPVGKSTWHTVAKIKLQQVKLVTARHAEFNLIPHARHFQSVDNSFLNEQSDVHFLLNPYFEKVDLDRVYFRQLRSDRVLTSPGEVWRQVSTKNRKKPAQLPWFDYQDASGQTKGRIAFTIQEKFIAHLNTRLGAAVANAKTYEPPARFNSKISVSKLAASSGLPIRWLRTVYVFDNRLRAADGELLHSKASGENAWTLAEAVSSFNTWFGGDYGVRFDALAQAQLRPDFGGVTLVLQDVRADDFVTQNPETGQDEWEFLGEAGFTDPKPALYREFPGVAKQSLTVNSNSTRTRNGEARFDAARYLDYFNYSKPEAVNFAHEMAVCLNELFLKKLLLQGGDVTDPAVNLPGFSGVNYPGGGAERLRSCAWMHDAVFLFVENNRLHFADLTDPEGKRLHREWLAERGVHWAELEARILEGIPEKDHDAKLRQGYFVFGPSYTFEIQDTEERVLFPYDSTRERQTRTKTTTKGMVGVGYLPAEQKYFVGSAEGLKSKEERAVNLRQLVFWHGSPTHLDDLLETLAVRFVRNGQHTVYPYPFDLIRLWVELIRSGF